MCLNPSSIPNPNYLNHPGKTIKAPLRGEPFFYKDRVNARIPIPCGHCFECITKRQMDLVQRCLMESMHQEIFMCMMSYNENIPSYNLNGFNIKYADMRDVQLMIKRLKKDNVLKYPFRYFVVSEFGGKRGRPHFHMLLFFPKECFSDYNDKLSYASFLKATLLSNWTRNIGNNRNPEYLPLCTYREKFINNKWRRNFDVQYCNPAQSVNGIADVAFYCLKYLLKPSDRETRLQQALRLNLSELEYNAIWPTVRCRSIYSTGFGLYPLRENKDKIQTINPNPEVLQYLRSCIDRSIEQKNPFPQFYNPINGLTFPLSGYYYDYLLTLNDLDAFYEINNPEGGDPSFVTVSRAYSEVVSKLEKSSRVLSQIHFYSDEYLDELCQ